MTFLGLGLVEHLPFNSVNSNMISKSHIGSVETLVWFMYNFFLFIFNSLITIVKIYVGDMKR